MAMDVYAPCPCGSGKKLKFCCANVAEDMDRISRLIENNQPRQALQQLELVEKKATGSSLAWVITTQAVVRLQIGESLLARDQLRKLLDQHPEQDFATVLYAVAILQTDGMDAARPAIARAFQKGIKRHPTMLSGIAAAMSTEFRERQLMLAAREHLALALRFAPEQQRQNIFVQLLDFDNDATVPYHLRSAHPLPAIEASEEIAADIKKAHKYAAVGCWDTAADIFEQLASKTSQQAEAWHSAGLCRAWYGDEQAAATALHKAAELYADAGAAVDCESLAQVFDWNLPSESVVRMERLGQAKSVGRLLTQFDAADRLFRMELPPPDPNGPPPPAAAYQVLAQSRGNFPAIADLNVDNVPRTLATLIVTDSEDDQPAAVIVTGIAGTSFDEACEIAAGAAGELVEWQDKQEQGERVPNDVVALTVSWIFPTKTPVAVRRHIENERSRQAIQNVWMTRPQKSLNGKSPREAAAIPELSRKLIAAVYVLDAVCLRGGYELDVPGVLQELNQQPLPGTVVTPETSLNTLSPLQWLRLPLSELSDEQLTAVANRAQLVHHDRFLYDTLRKILERPECMAQLDQTRVYQTLADLCRVHERREESFRWFEEGRKAISSGTQEFEQQWSWDLRELLMRLEDPTDPGLAALAQKFANYYAPKLPQMRPYLEQMFELAGVRSPWSASGILTTDSTGTPAGGLWTPDQAQPATAGSGLWMPGN